MLMDDADRFPTDGSPYFEGIAAERLTRGVCRLLAHMGYGTLTEFPLSNGRRVDVMGLSTTGEFAIVEVKSSLEDFRSDRKWQEYLPYCDRFFFAVDESFPHHLVPNDCGLIIADGFSAVVRRAPPAKRFDRARKRQQLVRFAMTASQRLRNMVDPLA
jgi:hypothetical protein